MLVDVNERDVLVQMIPRGDETSPFSTGDLQQVTFELGDFDTVKVAEVIMDSVAAEVPGVVI